MAGLPYIFTNVGNPEIDATQVNADFNYVLNNATATAVASGADLSVLGLYNPYHYGVKADGTTDDTSAWRSLFNSIGANGGRVSGWFGASIITAPIERPAYPVLMQGLGMGISVLKLGASFAGGEFFYNVTATPFQDVCDITFDFNGANLTTVPQNFQAIWMGDHSRIVRCEFKNRQSLQGGTANFWLFLNHNDNDIVDCWFHDDIMSVNTMGTIAGTGSQVVTPTSNAGMFVGQTLWIGAGTASPELVIVSAVGTGTFTATFALTHSGSVSIQGSNTQNDCIGGGSPSTSVTSSGTRVRGCRFSNLWGDAYQRTNAFDSTISGCTVINCLNGIMVQGGDEHTVSNNVIDASGFGIFNTGSIGAGIFLNPASGSADSHNIAISGNTVNQMSYGILVSPGGSVIVRGLTIAGNALREVLYDGINVGGVNGCSISGNSIRNANNSGVSNQPGTSTPLGAIFVTGGSNGSITGNTITDDRGTPLTPSGVSINAGTNWTISDNTISGNTGSGVTIASGVTNARVRGNLGYNPVGYLSSQPAVPASNTVYTNTSGLDCFVQISNGTVTNIAIGGHGIGGFSTFVGVIVPAGQTITLTYSSAPTWVWFGD